jgi:hypothetical protein
MLVNPQLSDATSQTKPPQDTQQPHGLAAGQDILVSLNLAGRHSSRPDRHQFR